MALSVTGEQVEEVLRERLVSEGFRLLNPPREHGETGADIVAERDGSMVVIECIGFQDVPPLRSKQFFELFFRALSRIGQGAPRAVMALPQRFGRGLNQRARQYGTAWRRVGDAFPELEIWLVDVEARTYERRRWNDWPVAY